ncbi:protein serine threonine phosphatase 2C [Coniophora puteana RWD-64-598 SS2]|uniref:Protein serine threonine phosphatase 2C n=1 Tax=Coniophora puteana (strain RWD-64-598) TaxID=741705 RepID=A0A5M3MVK2_CONPW|nr:protein serine threonine phosphatase 2C [Coniophora puteana RWD-64-598 SS2]EIW83047.1 protein serine threonine phosphatase 2C [Coniophora puteana RWD-64-598 SS2]
MHPSESRLDNPNAHSKSITTADGTETYGILNQHSNNNTRYQVGISEDKGTRRYMEDAHSFIVDFAGVRGQGFFAVFDGHAGKHAAEWCGAHFHEHLLDTLNAHPDAAIPDVLNETFHSVDKSISQMCQESDGKIHSGCTAVTAFLRIEDTNGKQPFLTDPGTPKESGPFLQDDDATHDQGNGSDSGSGDSGEDGRMKKNATNASRISRALRSLGGGSSSLTSSMDDNPKGASKSNVDSGVVLPPPSLRRVLYSANCGDARAVLCRAGKAVRLTYDHKGSDKQEAKRIVDAGGFVMSGRVNGVLAVTRSLGDSSMKEFVVGSPYTTETELCDDDEFLILACDGLWDITGDQGAIELVRHVKDAQQASQALVNYALSRQTNDNVTVLVVRFK